MRCVGLTGTIASGKSTAAKIFANLGAKVISADQISREITAPNELILKAIADKFGKDILNDQGELRRDKLREIIFNNIDDRIWLEELLHPLIRARIYQEIKSCDAKYCIIEIPLLTNRENFPYLNYVLLITTNKNKQLNRILSRDKTTKEQAKKIIASQANENTYVSVADKIIINDGSIDELEKQLIILDELWTKSRDDLI